MNSKRKKAAVRLVGGEPDGSAIVCTDPSYKITLISALNWYNREKVLKDAVAYVKDYVKANGNKALIEAVDKTAQSIPATMGWVARLISTGAVLGEQELNKFNSFLNSLKPAKPMAAPTKAAPRGSIQDSIKEKASTILGELEGAFDDFKSGQDFSLKSWLNKNEIPAAYMPFIEAWLQRKMGEYVTVYKAFTARKDDPGYSELAQIKEGYSNFNGTQVKRFLNFFKTSLEDVQSYAAVKKANRAPRKKKAIPPGVQVKKLKYLKAFEDLIDDLKLESVSPIDIIGAQQLWVYNTKYRKLGVYKSDTHQGLSVKGTTVQGYVPEQSIQKTLRKPKAVLKGVIEGGKITLRRVLENVNAKESPLNGRINQDIILLRVVK